MDFLKGPSPPKSSFSKSFSKSREIHDQIHDQYGPCPQRRHGHVKFLQIGYGSKFRNKTSNRVNMVPMLRLSSEQDRPFLSWFHSHLLRFVAAVGMPVDLRPSSTFTWHASSHLVPDGSVAVWPRTLDHPTSSTPRTWIAAQWFQYGGVLSHSYPIAGCFMLTLLKWMITRGTLRKPPYVPWETSSAAGRPHQGPLWSHLLLGALGRAPTRMICLLPNLNGIPGPSLNDIQATLYQSGWFSVL